ncbi:energy-coupling factor transport system ATP-binding protein [Streptococcus gallinaceus]|uniref:ABC transporter ATP-binding protein n=1 Tax=Streptococcus gallinaceus TaxID=165758 RepID=UPI0020A1D790|nr:ABC transporter ATP-binding protein [Streptococcus gallinaceus]MCP1638444.1 energy-coupling factor transport system ATP-binding protein [Streptococcus gallinaceus]MCP1769469.1 energy-coupling factor transport system ATP-binding protein [Streptococcus gallinaceus]
MEHRNVPLHQPIITADALTFTYHPTNQLACQIDSLKIFPGECILVVGPSGSGKSTFLKLLNGLAPEYFGGSLSGKLTIAGLEVGQESTDILAQQVASVFQHPSSQFFHTIVEHELVLPCEQKEMPRPEIAKKLQEVCQNFELENLLKRSIHTLSGGEQKRLALACASMQDTPILVLDEPTANLDAAGAATIQTQIQQLKSAGKTILVAEHRLNNWIDLADRILYFSERRLEKIFTRDNIQKMSPDQRKNLALRSLDLTEAKQHIQHKIHQSSKLESKNGLFIEKLPVRTKGQASGLLTELAVPAGTVIGLVGANGSGKSSLAQQLVGLRAVRNESILWNDTPQSAPERLQHMSLLLQDVRLQLFAPTVEQELRLGSTSLDQLESIRQALKLDHLMNRHPASLSGGEQQRLLLATSLLSGKDFLILDEPSSGLDYLQMLEVAQLLQQAKQHGQTILLISHDSELLDLVCDSIIDLEQALQKNNLA